MNYVVYSTRLLNATHRATASRRNRAAAWSQAAPSMRSTRKARSDWRNSRAFCVESESRKWCRCTARGSNCSRFRCVCREHLCDLIGSEGEWGWGGGGIVLRCDVGLKGVVEGSYCWCLGVSIHNTKNTLRGRQGWHTTRRVEGLRRKKID